MSIDWSQFTPLASAAGGLMIGTASALLLVLDGRVAGVSGIVGGLLRPAAGEVAWRLAFVAGLALAPAVYGAFAAVPEPVFSGSAPLLAAAGLAVGIGTRFGSGCTSGHGVCGMSRASPRSAAATAMFLATGFLTVFVLRHL